MPDIYTNPQVIERRWRTRAKKIVITNPPSEAGLNCQKQIIFDVENIPYDNNIPQFDQAQAQPPLKVNVNDVATQIFTVLDPVTGKNVTISVAGVAAAIESGFVTWAQK